MRNRNRGEISRRRFLGYSSVPLLAAWPGIAGLGLHAGEEAPQWRASVGKSISLPDPPRPAGIEYINPDIPDFKDPEYPGEYYDALVPATLDLAERARLAIHGVTSMTNPNIDYEMYFGVSHMSQPPAMNHSASDMHCQGKFSEVLPLLRMMCGSLQNMNVETAWTKVLASSTGRCNTSVKSFCRSFKLQRLTGPFVQLTCHLVQMRLRVHRQVRSLGEVLSE